MQTLFAGALDKSGGSDAFMKAEQAQQILRSFDMETIQENSEKYLEAIANCKAAAEEAMREYRGRQYWMLWLWYGRRDRPNSNVWKITEESICEPILWAHQHDSACYMTSMFRPLLSVLQEHHVSACSRHAASLLGQFSLRFSLLWPVSVNMHEFRSWMLYQLRDCISCIEPSIHWENLN